VRNRNGLTQAVIGFVGTACVAALVLAAIRFSDLPFVRDGYVLDASFVEAGGLETGDPVLVSGATVGTVDSIDLDRGVVRIALRVKNGDLRLGDTTEAKIVTTTLLGQAGVQLDPSGEGAMGAGDTIGVDRTSSPYDITAALSDLTTEASAIDVEQLSSSLTTLSGTFKDTPDDVKQALSGLDSIASAVSDNDEALQQLLDRASRVTGVLADRDQKVATLLSSGQSLLRQLNARQQVVTDLLDDAGSLSAQLSAVARENDAVLGPSLTQLNKVIAVLNDNKKNLQKAIIGLRGYATNFGDALGTGPWFDAYIQNLTSPGTLAPVISEFLQ
jgi:phospholipid/cholesterol/gamma-HCH transport system substrate-binding protein